MTLPKHRQRPAVGTAAAGVTLHSHGGSGLAEHHALRQFDPQAFIADQSLLGSNFRAAAAGGFGVGAYGHGPLNNAPGSRVVNTRDVDRLHPVINYGGFNSSAFSSLEAGGFGSFGGSTPSSGGVGGGSGGGPTLVQVT